MKPITLFSLLFYILLATSSCKKDCEPDITRPALSADALQWVEVINKNPKFKITTVDSQGKTKIDTIQGTYTLSNGKASKLIDECYTIYYDEYGVALSLPYGQGNYGEGFLLDNYLEKGYRGKITGPYYLNENTLLDTAFVNGKLYSNVYKLIELDTKYYYAKGVGFIYIKLTERLELIP